MKVSGFTFIRNAIKYDYPVVEAITSVLPLCDEFVVAVGNSDDNTRGLIESIGSPKIRITDTVWDDTLREGGRVLAVETDKAFDALSADSDWAIYIQGDEVLHEQYLDTLREAMQQWKDHPEVEGLLLNYLHFYGSYDFTGDSRRWYRREVRVIRNDKSIRSYRDAQGFRKNNKPLKVKPVNATMHHYGWVKPPEFQQAKQEYFHKLWHNDEWVEKKVPKADAFDYSSIDSLAKFTGTHPAVIQPRINRQNWQFTFDPTKKKLPFKSRLLHGIEALTGWRIGEYRNYKV
ncbi:MAG: glycosyl transferase [Bacteroidetes bacterium HGW-Bacteroidetes-11]|jgi:glycosyltransferase involved in cell wall biosynthesis|nr:MAG: glycosyl transferase [Bacteroidetes bacterium HGW-Bacteroidetes-11]